MSRKDRHQSTENNETQEPWEQPIYDTDDEVSSRSSQRQQKKGNTLFLSLFLIYWSYVSLFQQVLISGSEMDQATMQQQQLLLKLRHQ